jgi:proline dehydrogenase
MVEAIRTAGSKLGAAGSARLNPALRKGILLATNNPVMQRGVRRFGMRLGASRFVAGETLDQAVAVLLDLNRQGLRVNTTILGEAVSDAAAADAVTDEYAVVIRRLVDEGINGNVALKLTHLGLDLGEEFAFRNVERLVREAAGLGAFIRIDMEESSRVDQTLSIYKRLREAGYDNVGTVLQSYLYRTEQDLNELLPYEPNLRLVKGAYLEPESVAFPGKADVDRNYVKLADTMLERIRFTAIATHDQAIIDHVLRKATNGSTMPFEFQMLYGIRSQYQRELAS